MQGYSTTTQEPEMTAPKLAVSEVPDPLMTTEGVAGYFQLPIASIYSWRARGEGPRAIRVGKHLRWRKSDIDAWLERQADAPAV
jgi:excisionase family DNA binding protein